jgi:hypothetical protein
VKVAARYRSIHKILLAALVVALVVPGRAAGGVVPAWANLGDDGGGDGALNGRVNAIAVSGTSVYVGGTFTNAAGIPEADYVARWDGSSWHALGSYLGDGAIHGSASVDSLAVWGGDLYVGGTFDDVAGLDKADNIARWNGSSWSALGANGSNGAVNNRVVTIESSTSYLYVGGFFTNVAGNSAVDYLARWSGSAWSGVGGGVNNNVYSLAVSGSYVYVGGQFTNAGAIDKADWIARWNGSTWSAVGSIGPFYPALNNIPLDLELSGGNLYAAGLFYNAYNDAKADYIAWWDGTDWHSLGSNNNNNGAMNGPVKSIEVANGYVYAGGNFYDAGTEATADYVAAWDGNSWSGLGSDGAGNGALLDCTELPDCVSAVAVGNGQLYVGGAFIDVAGIGAADNIASYGPLPGPPPPPPQPPQPDGRISKGTGTFIGNDVYNSTGVNQTKEGAKPSGRAIKFGISIQNDGPDAQAIEVAASGAATTMYKVTYWQGTTDITAAVEQGTYTTPLLASGAALLITAKVKVKSTATAGSSVTRLVTLSAVGDPAYVDAVKFIGKRS